jgi:hypothetical protein
VGSNPAAPTNTSEHLALYADVCQRPKSWPKQKDCLVAVSKMLSVSHTHFVLKVFRRHSDHFGCVLRTHLLKDPHAVHLDCLLGGPHDVGNLFVEQTFGHKF